MPQIPVEKTFLDKEEFFRVINEEFSQFGFGNQSSGSTSTISIEDFFRLYEELFYQIPKEGDVNSHKYILDKETAYLDVRTSTIDVQALLDEITALRQELFDTQTIISTLSQTNA